MTRAPSNDVVQTEQRRLLYAALPPAIVSTIVLAALCVFVLWPTVPHDALLGWLSVQVALSSVRLGQWLQYRRTAPQHAAVAVPLTSFRITAAAASIVWGALAIVCYPPDLPRQVFLAFVIAGVTSAAITSLAPDRRTSISFLVVGTVPLAIQLLRTPDYIDVVMGVMVVLFLAFTALSARRAYAQFVDNIQLRAQANAAQAELESALAEISLSRAQLEAFIEHAPAAVAMFDVNLRYLAHSRRWLTDYGLEGRQLIGRSHYEVFPEIDEDWKAVHRRCLQGSIEGCQEDPFRRADGTVQWLHWEVRPWRNVQGDIGGIVMLSEDITERRAANDAVRASTELLRKLSNRVPGVIYQHCQRSTGRREFLFVSPGVKEMFGLDRQQLLTDAALLFKSVHPADRAAVLAYFTARPGQSTQRSCDYRVVLKGGGERWIHDESVAEIQDDGSVLSYGHITDITERKSAEDEWRRLNERMSLATESGGIGIWEWDLVAGTLAWDERMYVQYGLSPARDSINLETWRRCLHSADLPRTTAALQSTIETGSDLDIEYRILCPDGTERTLKASARVQRDKAGKPLRMTGVSWDITALRRVERMKSEFVSVVSHELRTPLTSLRGSIGLIAAGAAGPVSEQMRHLLEIAGRNGERLVSLIDDLLDLDKMDAGKMHLALERTDLLDLVRQSIETNAALATAFGVTFRLLESSVTGWVEVDPRRLQQVLANLLSNAAKFSDAGMQVEIAVLRKDGGLRVEVRDRGPGVPEEFRPRLFQKFSQADSSDTRAKGGTGLGLAVSKSIVDACGGAIGCDSRPGGGSTFYFELPEHRPQ